MDDLKYGFQIPKFQKKLETENKQISVWFQGFVVGFAFFSWSFFRLSLFPASVKQFNTNRPEPATLMLTREQIGNLRGGADSPIRLRSTITAEAQVSKPSPSTRGLKLAEYKRKQKLSDRQKQIAVGVMLGDASLQTQNDGKEFRLKFQGSIKHKKYGERLYRELDNFCLSPIKERSRVNSNENIVENWEFQTLSHEEFKPIANIFYPNGIKNSRKKITPDLVENHVTPTALAYWFMDDGSKMDHTPNSGKGIHLHTQGFEEQEVQFLCDGLTKRYGLICWKVKNKGKYVVSISGNSYEQFVKLIEPDLDDSMKYKVPSARKLRRSNTI